MAQIERTGLFQYLQWGLTNVPALPFGLISGGDLSTDPGTRKRIGTGGLVIRKGGLVKLGGSASFYLSKDNVDLVNAGLRASYPRGALTDVYIEGGCDEWGRLYGPSWITDGSIDYSQDEGLRAGVTWGSMAVSEKAGGTMPALTGDDFEDWELVLDIGGAEYSITQFGIKWTNNVSFKGAGNTPTAAFKRFPKVRRYGIEDLTVDVTTDKPIPTSAMAVFYDCLDTDLTAAITGENCDGDTIEIVLTALAMQNPESHAIVDPNTDVQWKYGFSGSGDAGSMAITLTPGA